jgi:hypothetical protein
MGRPHCNSTHRDLIRIGRTQTFADRISELNRVPCLHLQDLREQHGARDAAGDAGHDQATTRHPPGTPRGPVLAAPPVRLWPPSSPPSRPPPRPEREARRSSTRPVSPAPPRAPARPPAGSSRSPRKRASGPPRGCSRPPCTTLQRPPRRRARSPPEPPPRSHVVTPRIGRTYGRTCPAINPSVCATRAREPCQPDRHGPSGAQSPEKGRASRAASRGGQAKPATASTTSASETSRAKPARATNAFH